jgi:hypothetical protein
MIGLTCANIVRLLLLLVARFAGAVPRVCPGEDRGRSAGDEGSVTEDGCRTVEVGAAVSPRTHSSTGVTVSIPPLTICQRSSSTSAITASCSP